MKLKCKTLIPTLFLIFFVWFFTLILRSNFNSEAQEIKRVNLTVLYESLCQGCKDFITTQLYQSYNAVGAEFVNLELVPYGNVMEEEFNSVLIKVCQHGEEECYGNKLHGCVLEHNHIKTSLDFIYCCELADNPVDKSILQQCAKWNNILWSNVENCLNNGEADRLFEKNGKITKNLNPEYVPYLVFNGVFNKEMEQEALNGSLTNILCSLISGSIKPRICKV